MKKKQSGTNTAGSTGEQQSKKDTERGNSPTHDEIALVAFGLYESRGRGDGRAMEDWVQAEQELMRHYA